MTQKKLITKIVAFLLLFMSVTAVYAGEPSCFAVTHDYNKKTKITTTTLKKGKKTIATYPIDLNFLIQVTGEYAYFTSDNSRYNVVIGCDGKVKIDSIEQSNFMICTQGYGGDRTEQRMGFAVARKNKIYFYDLQLQLMKNTGFDEAQYSPSHKVNNRPDLYPNLKDLYLLYVAKKIDNKTVWGVYDVQTQQLIMQPLYQKVESTSAQLFYYAQFGFIEFVNPTTNKKQLYHFFDKPVPNTEYEKSDRSFIYETNIPRAGTAQNKMCLMLDSKYISEDGSAIPFPKNDDIEVCGLYAKLTRDKKVGVYDFSGKEIVPIQFDAISAEYCKSSRVLERYMPVKNGICWAYYDTERQKLATDFIYKYAYPFSKGVGSALNLKDENEFISFNLNETQLSERSAAMQADFEKLDKEAYSYINYRAGEQKDLIAKINGGTMTKNEMLYEVDKMAAKNRDDQKKVIALIDAYKNKWGQSLSSRDEKYFDDCENYFISVSNNMVTLIKKVKAAK